MKRRKKEEEEEERKGRGGERRGKRRKEGGGRGKGGGKCQGERERVKYRSQLWTSHQAAKNRRGCRGVEHTI
jgi:hypothetical protein